MLLNGLEGEIHFPRPQFHKALNIKDVIHLAFKCFLRSMQIHDCFPFKKNQQKQNSLMESMEIKNYWISQTNS